MQARAVMGCGVCERYTAGSYRLRYKYGSSKWCCTVCASGDRLCKTNPLYTDHSLSSADPAAQSAVKAQTKKHSRTKHARTQAVPAKNSHPQRQAITDGSLPARALRCTTTHLQGRLSPSPYLHRHLRLPSLSHTNTHHLRHHHCHRHRPQSEPPTTNQSKKKTAGRRVPVSPNHAQLHTQRLTSSCLSKSSSVQTVSIGPCRRR